MNGYVWKWVCGVAAAAIWAVPLVGVLRHGTRGPEGWGVAAILAGAFILSDVFDAPRSHRKERLLRMGLDDRAPAIEAAYFAPGNTVLRYAPVLVGGVVVALFYDQPTPVSLISFVGIAFATLGLIFVGGPQFDRAIAAAS
jgi:hypothetical protein